MYPLKQSTAFNGIFFAHDVNGDAVTGKVDGDWTKRISKNAGAFAAMTVTVTEMEAGFYSFTLSSSHTDTLDLLTVRFSATGVKQVNLMWRVTARTVDDIMPTYTQPTGFLAATFPSGTVANTTNITAGTITTTTNLTNLPAITANWLTATGINADAFTAAKFADDVSTEFANKTWDTDATGHQTTGTFGQAIGDPVADTNTIYGAVVTGAVGATVSADIITLQADTDDIQTRLPAALVSGRMDSSTGAMASGVVTATAIATDAIGAAEIAAAGANKIADHVLRRNYANVRTSSDGDTLAFRSLLGGDAKLVNKWSIAGSTLTVYHDDDTTVFGTQAITGTPGADPITALDTT